MAKYLKKMGICVVLAVFAVNTTGCNKAFLIHPEFKQRQADIFTAAIVSPEVDAYMLTFQGDKKRMHELIPVLEKITTERIQVTLEDRGYIVQELDLSEENLKKKPELRTTLFNVRKLFNKSIDDIAKRKKKDEFTYSLGSDVNILAGEADADILIFVKENAIKKSAGQVAKEIAKDVLISVAFAALGGTYTSNNQYCSTVAYIAIVDSNDGAILWYTNNVGSSNYDPEHEKSVKSMLKSLLKHMPESVNKNKLRSMGPEEKEALLGEVEAGPEADTKISKETVPEMKPAPAAPVPASTM